MNIDRFNAEVSTIVDKSRVYTDELRRLAWGTDAGFYKFMPQVILRSKDEGEVSAILKAASKYNVPVTFRAAGTSLSGQSVTDSVLVVAGKNWEQISTRDEGMTHPELNAYALRKLRSQIQERGIEVGYSNSRTCEIGLQTNSGIPYRSIVYLVNNCTSSRAEDL